jgi:hypothetical protein
MFLQTRLFSSRSIRGFRAILSISALALWGFRTIQEMLLATIVAGGELVMPKDREKDDDRDRNAK